MHAAVGVVKIREMEAAKFPFCNVCSVAIHDHRKRRLLHSGSASQASKHVLAFLQRWVDSEKFSEDAVKSYCCRKCFLTVEKAQRSLEVKYVSRLSMVYSSSY